MSFAYTYDPWGLQTLTAGGTGNGAGQNLYAFHAGIKDRGSGLIKFGQRWYDPTSATWAQQDTPDNPLDPANANRYAYAGDDPINGQDPSGRFLGLAHGTTAFADLAAIALTVLDVVDILSVVAAAAPTLGTSAIAGPGAAVGSGVAIWF